MSCAKGVKHGWKRGKRWSEGVGERIRENVQHVGKETKKKGKRKYIKYKNIKVNKSNNNRIIKV